MAKLIVVVLGAVFLTACSSGFQHRLPVRESYIQVKLGEPIPQSIEPTNRVVVDDQQVLVGVSAEQDWKYSTGANEWAMYLLDANETVVAKHYLVDGDEATIMPFHIKRISEADWSWLMQPAVADPYVEAREICAKLRPEAFGWTVGSYDIQAMSDDDVGPILAETVLGLAEKEGSWVRGHFNFKKKVGLEKQPPVIERSLRHRLTSEGRIASMAEYRRLRFSGAQMAAMGWAHSIRTDELP